VEDDELIIEFDLESNATAFVTIQEPSEVIIEPFAESMQEQIDPSIKEPLCNVFVFISLMQPPKIKEFETLQIAEHPPILLLKPAIIVDRSVKQLMNPQYDEINVELLLFVPIVLRQEFWIVL